VKNWPDTSNPNYKEELFKKYVIDPQKCNIQKSSNSQKKPNPTYDPRTNPGTKDYYRSDVDVSAVHHGDPPYEDVERENHDHDQEVFGSTNDDFDQYSGTKLKINLF